MPNNVNNNVNTKVDQLIEGSGGTSIFRVSLFLFWGNILWEESLNNLLDQKTSGTCASCLHLERANDLPFCFGLTWIGNTQHLGARRTE